MHALLINDVHIGAVRSAGTTPATRLKIKDYLQSAVHDLLFANTDKDLIINGDLFDSYEVDTGDVLRLYVTLHRWLKETGRKIKLGRGNHDIAKNSMKTSSFAFLCSLLLESFPDQVQVIDEGLTKLYDYVWMIPHVVNQDSFDIELEKALEIEPSILLLHANYDNNFAVEADHSLNVSYDVAKKLVKHGHLLVFGHEHQGKTDMAGGIVITGNQWPSSISDCLAQGEAQKDGVKRAYVISTETEDMPVSARSKGVVSRTNVSLSMLPVETWWAEGDYVAMDWRDLQPSDCRFIRIEGEATAEQSADVINAVAKYRQKSEALVISNSVKVAGIAGVDDMATLSVENLQKINVLDALCEVLDKDEVKVVRGLLEGNNEKETDSPAEKGAVPVHEVEAGIPVPE